MVSEEAQAKYRQVRGALGLILAGTWIVFWWMKFDADKTRELAGCTGGNIFENIGKSMCEGNANGGFGMKLVMVIIVSPLAFWIAHYVARWWADQSMTTEQRQREQLELARRREHEATLSQIGHEAAEEASQTRHENDRHELITRLGTVDDQLIVLENEKDADRITRIKMTITQALREIDAKFTDEELQALQSAHRAVRQRVDRTLEMMRNLGLEGSRQYQDLSGMFGFGGTTEAERTEVSTATPEESPA